MLTGLIPTERLWRSCGGEQRQQLSGVHVFAEPDAEPTVEHPDVHESDVERGARDAPGVVSLDDHLRARVEEAHGLDVQFVVVGGEPGRGNARRQVRRCDRLG